MHEWQFLTAADGGAGVLVAVCPLCGLVRVAPLPATNEEQHMDLRGNCPGVPQEPEPTAGPIAP